jgi:predicted amidophosphoribosyltransferase
MRRGFNQSADLAEHLGLPVVHALWRTRATPRQAGLSAAERACNVRRAFRAAPWLTTRTRDRYLRDRVVILVDDVTTTGATLHACAIALRQAGAKNVRALTVALTLRTAR